MGLSERLRRRWAARAAPAPDGGRTSQASESVTLSHPPAAVWALVAPAENSALLVPDTTARAYTVPGTGPGVGEQQCHVGHDGRSTVLEVVELVEGRRAVAVVVSPRPAVPVRTVTSVEPLGTGSVLTYGMDFDGPPGSIWPRPQQDVFRAFAAAYLDRVRQVLDQTATGGAG